MDILLLAVLQFMNSDIIIGLIAAVFAGLGVKLFDYYSNRNEVDTDEAERLRQELRRQAQARQAEVERLEAEVMERREQTYELELLREEMALQNQELRMTLEMMQPDDNE